MKIAARILTIFTILTTIISIIIALKLINNTEEVYRQLLDSLKEGQKVEFTLESIKNLGVFLLMFSIYGLVVLIVNFVGLFKFKNNLNFAITGILTIFSAHILTGVLTLCSMSNNDENGDDFVD
ncbi:MAG: hypothetical protein IJP63_02275 [Acholeplasmatales bacterium]|nr:hypothetical protein [Acholeplasmatales bacterium]